MENNKEVDKVINYIPARYIFSVLLFTFEILSILAIIILLTIYVPYFYIAVIVTEVLSIISLVCRDANPNYKIPWLIFVFVVPVVGFMCYFMFYSRTLNKRQSKKLDEIKKTVINKENNEISEIKKEDFLIASEAIILTKLSSSKAYKNTNIKYFEVGEKMFISMLKDLEAAKEFILMEYFIIESGLFWNKILEVLKRKAKEGVKVYVIYDDIGSMMTLPGNYSKILKKYNIIGLLFAKLKGQANNEFNNRSHRKITSIDGTVGYTGGINIADEYINHVVKHGHWKDVGIRLHGEAVCELTRLFIIDYNLNVKKEYLDLNEYLRTTNIVNTGYCIPFGDGPKPLFERPVSKTIIMNMLDMAKKYVYITTPYLIIDNGLKQSIENAALRGIDVRIITPHIPDKKLIFTITRGYYKSLINAGLKIYEYKPGFIHAKTYISDDTTSIIATINLDYRSLVHHFENGVWMYRHEVIHNIKDDFLNTQEKSIKMETKMLKKGLIHKFILDVLKVFTPLL